MPLCDRFGFFNGIYGLEQVNWSNYWREVVPDGVIGGIGNEMLVFGASEGMKVKVMSGQAIVDNHRVWITTTKEVPIAKASANPRIDYIVLRITYGNTGASKVDVTSITGTPSATPVAPTLSKVTGGYYDLPLATVNVGKNVSTITAASVTDKRYIFHLASSNSALVSRSISTSDWKIPYGNGLICENDREYRVTNVIKGLAKIYLPTQPCSTYITGVCFTAGAAYKGVEFYTARATYDSTKSAKKLFAVKKISPAIIGDSTKIVSKRYNLIIWWDGNRYWVACKYS